MLACQEVQSIQISLVCRNQYAMICSFHGDNRFENRTLTVLNPLTHGMQIGCQIYRCGENTFTVFTFALSIKLFPPFCDIMQFRMEVSQDLNLFTALIQLVTSSGIDSGHIISERNARVCSFFHGNSSSNQVADADTCHGDRKQTYRSQN